MADMDPHSRAQHPSVHILQGRDSYGSWKMATSEALTAGCPLCEQPAHAVLRYYQLHLPQDIPVERTILKRTRNPIGVDCGCYAKFHRQVVHITESGLRKGLPV